MGKASTRAQNRYIAKAYDRINLTVAKGQKENIQAHAAARSESVNGFIGRAIVETMERDGGGAVVPGTAPVERVLAEMPAEGPQEAAGAAAVAGGISLPPHALESAQAAAEATGEATAVFIARAIETQAKRDKSSIALGINPATGDKLKGEA